jgi:SAM-dependent methyltransferase
MAASPARGSRWPAAAFLRDGASALHDSLLRFLYATPAFRWTGKPLAKLVSSTRLPGSALLPRNPLFDTGFYASKYPDIAGVRNLWAHYLAFGASESRNPHPLFDTHYYVARNRDVAASGINPLMHYFKHGAAEGRDPGERFDTSWYIDRYPDVRSEGVNPLLHYWLHGRAESRLPSAHRYESRTQIDVNDPPAQAGTATAGSSAADGGQFTSNYLRVLVPSPEMLNTSIHPNDEMYVFTERAFHGQRNQALCSYFGTGKQIYDAVRQVVDWRFGGFRNVSSFLDFAAGYGRSTRFIVLDLSPGRLWVSEISRTAVQFQEAEFGVHGLLSQTNPEEFVCDQRFGCIAVVSLFTHLPERTFVPWLRRLCGLLETGGCLIFSTHGPTVNPNLTIPDSGLRFEEQSEIDTLSKQDYGSTFVTERFVRRAIQEATNGEGVCRYLPQGLCRFQDLYVVTRSQPPGLDDLDYSSGPSGWLDSCLRAKANEFRLSGWAADVARVPEVQVFIDGTLLRTCVPSEPRSDVKARYADLANSGFSCACRVDKRRLSGRETLTIKAVGDKELEFILYHDTIAAALARRG